MSKHDQPRTQFVKNLSTEEFRRKTLIRQAQRGRLSGLSPTSPPSSRRMSTCLGYIFEGFQDSRGLTNGAT
jgi:hypothetical protein